MTRNALADRIYGYTIEHIPQISISKNLTGLYSLSEIAANVNGWTSKRNRKVEFVVDLPLLPLNLEAYENVPVEKTGILDCYIES